LDSGETFLNELWKNQQLTLFWNHHRFVLIAIQSSLGTPRQKKIKQIMEKNTRRFSWTGLSSKNQSGSKILVGLNENSRIVFLLQISYDFAINKHHNIIIVVENIFFGIFLLFP
jgi:hypothetical protein